MALKGEKEMLGIAYCGLDCKVCNGKTNEKREISKKLMSFVPEMDEYVKFLGDPRYDGWTQFKEVLGAISEHPNCPGCQKDGGDPNCKVRVCVRERELEFCYKCCDFPCGKLHPMMVEASMKTTDAMSKTG